MQNGKAGSMMDFQSAYKRKRVFITGHTGFKGSWLAAWLQVLGAEIKGYALPPAYDNGLFQLLQKTQGYESILADIRQSEQLKNELVSFSPDFVFHLAAQPLVRRSYEIPAETFDVNPELLDGFIFYSDGYYEIAYDQHFSMNTKAVKNSEARLLARFETIVPDKEFAGKKIEYYMREPDILISGKDEAADKEDIFRIPSEWVNTPHLRVRFNDDDHKFYLASFGEKTLVNENEVVASDANNPVWVPLPLNSRIVLNGIVGVNIFKS